MYLFSLALQPAAPTAETVHTTPSVIIAKSTTTHGEYEFSIALQIAKPENIILYTSYNYNAKSQLCAQSEDRYVIHILFSTYF